MSSDRRTWSRGKREDRSLDRIVPLAALLLLVPLTLPVTGTAGTVTTVSQPLAAGVSITIDGDVGEWQELPTSSRAVGFPQVAVTHDGRYLFLMFSFDDRGLARRLLSRGVIVWLNGDGRTKNKHEQLGIRYCGSRQIAEHLRDPDPPRVIRDSAGGRRHHRQPDTGHYSHHAGASPRMPRPDELTVIRRGVKEVVPAAAAEGPAAAAAVIDGHFCYEMRIPLAEVQGRIADQPPSKRRKIAVGIEIGGLTQAERELMMWSLQEPPDLAGPPPAAAGMTGGPSGTGRPGGFRVPGNPQRRLKTKIAWLKVTLEPVRDHGVSDGSR